MSAAADGWDDFAAWEGEFARPSLWRQLLMALATAGTLYAPPALDPEADVGLDGHPRKLGPADQA